MTVNADGTLTYTPAANYNGPDTITYTVSDGQGGESTATVAVGVTPVNDGPVAVDDTATTAEDTPVTIDVLSNDTDVEGDALSVATDAGKAPTALHGTVTVNADGTLTYTPAANYNGPDTITYTVSDGHGGESTATVAMTVNEVNDVDTTPDTATAYEDWYNPVGNVLFNDSEWYRLEVTGAGHENGEQGMVVKGDYGTLYIGANGWYRYELDNSLDAVQALGRDETVTENFTYTVSDGQGGTSTTPLTITVHGMNDLPVANDDTLVTSEAQSAVIDVLANDTDVDGDVLSVVGEPYAPHGTVVVNDDGTLTYTPDQGFVGQDTIYYYMTDGSHYYTQAEVSVTVNQNLAPIAGDDQFSTAEDTSLSITAAQLLANDSDPEGTGLTITEVHNGAHGTVELVNGEITFTPDADYNGDATFTYTVADASGKETTATATVTVTATNDAPVAVDDEFGATTVIEPVTISVDVALHESHPNIEANWASKGVIVKAFAGNGLDQSTWLGEGEGPKPKLDHGNIDWDGDHHNDYTGLAVKSVHNLNNEQIDLLDGSEGTGTELLAVSFDGKTVQSVTLTLGALFDADDGAIWNGDLTEMARVAAFDADGNLLGYVDVDGDLDGLVNVTLDVAELGYPAPIAEVAVMPLQNGAGDDPANSDFVLKAVTATTTGGVEGVFYEDQTIELDATQLITAANAAGEADSDVDGDLLTVTDVFNPTHGSVTLTDEGKVVFEPDDDFSGQATFQYTVSDGHGGTDTATVTLNITPNDNEAPSIDLDATGSNFDINAEASDSWGYNLLGMYVLDDAGNPVVTEVLYDYSNVDGPRDLNPGDLLTHLEEGQTPHFFVLNSEEVRTGPAFREDVEITFTKDDDGQWWGTGVNENGEAQTFKAFFDDASLNRFGEQFRIDATDASDGTQHWSFEEFIRNAQDNTTHAIDWDDVRFTVTPVDDDASGYNATFSEGGDPVSIAGNLSIGDADSGSLSKAVITLTNAHDGDTLHTDGLPGDLLVEVDSSTPGRITVTLTGDASPAEYAEAIKSITFGTTSGDETPREITVQVTDAEGNKSLASNTATATINVEAGDADMVNLDVTGQQVHFVSQNAGYNNMLGIYRLDAHGDPVDPEIILPSSHSPELVASVLATFGGDEDIRFFLIPDGGDMNIDFSQELHFIPHGDTWELSVGALNNSHYVDVKFDDPGLNPTTEEPGFQFPQGEDAGITVHVDESVLVKVDDQFSGGDDDDYNDLIIDVRGSEHGLFHGGDGNDTAYGNEGNDTLHGHDGNDLLVGGDGNDLLVGGHGDDQLFGGHGDDVIVTGQGHDLVHTGEGSDVIHIDPSVLDDGNSVTVEDYTLGTDSLELGDGLKINDVIYDDDNSVTRLLISDEHGGHDVVVDLLGVTRTDLSHFESHVDPSGGQVDDLIQYLIDSGSEHK